MPIIAIWDLSDITADDGNFTTTGSTIQSNTDEFTLGGSATAVSVSIDDDDINFDDGSFPSGGGGNETGVRSTVSAGSSFTIDGVTVTGGEFIDLEFGSTGLINGTTPVTVYMISIGNNNVGFVTVPQMQPGDTISGLSGNYFDNPTTTYESICFAKGTQIETPNGYKSVETLTVGDEVLNQHGETITISWIGQQYFSAAQMTARPNLRPIKIAAGALGTNSPSSDLIVSPQHRIFLTDWRAKLMFGFDQYLTAAKLLLNDTTITHAPIEDVEYFHIMFDRHEIIRANGQLAESFYIGDRSLNTLDEKAREEVMTIFPELRENSDFNQSPAAPILKSFERKALKNVGA